MAKSKMLKIEQQTEKKPYILLYARVSTDRQAEEGYSIEIQKERLAAYVKSLYGTDEAQTELFVDDGYSGGNLERPAMQRMIQSIKEGNGTHVIVYKLDRLSRSQKDTLYLIEDVFLAHGVAFISVLENFNTATPFGRAVIGILSVFAQFERENIYERTRSGMQKRIESGLWMGGGRVPFGYDYNKERGILVPNKDAETVRSVYDLYLKGYSLQRIANQLGLKYERLAYQIMTRKSNTGCIVYNGVEYPGQHEPIVSLEVYERAMAQLAERSQKKYVSKTPYLLTGLVHCGVCGAKMRYMKWGNKGTRLVCYSKMKSKPYLVKDPNCTNENIDAETIENIVIEDMFNTVKNDFSQTDTETQTTSITELLEKRRDELMAKLKRLYSFFADSEDEALLDTIADIKKQLSEVEKNIQAEKEKNFWSDNLKRAREELKSLRDTWDYMTPEEKRTAVRSVVDSITITHNDIKIYYKF